MTQDTLKPVSQATLIPQLQECVGLILDGLEALNKINPSQNNRIIATILTDLCAKSWDMGRIMGASQTPSPDRPSSPSTSFKISSQSISKPSLRTFNGNDGLMISYEDLATWLLS